ncbi:MAG TPA: reverse transcriptase domain-containing protein [Candidatus Nanoarchaeia archaeon]|nr:reverse transcriptase domain-containing protein [Candidatus Nanoarchaeia archaeon]
MKTYRNLFPQLCSPENIELAFRKARRGKTAKRYVQEFEQKLSENLEQLRLEILIGTYDPKPLQTFILRDPKTRKISVSDFRDRVVHHAIVNILEPIFEQYFISDSYANRKGKGTLAALERFEAFKRKVSRNGTGGYVLKADIRKYFDEVDHRILLRIIGERITDARVQLLILRILNNHQGTAIGKSMPLGNLTSQFFANVYLDALDQFVKHHLRAKYYLRYVDDFILLHHSQKQLQQWTSSIAMFLQTALLLTIHPQKCRILRLKDGVDFLGFKCFSQFRLLRRRNIRNMQQKLRYFSVAYPNREILAADILECVQGWNAYAMHANTYRLRRSMRQRAIAIIQH